VLELVRDAYDLGALAGHEGSQQARRPRRPSRHRVAVRAGLRVAQDRGDSLLHLGGHGVLEALGLVVRLPPGVAEDVDEEALDQPVAPHHPVRGGRAGRREAQLLAVVEGQQPIALEAVDHLRDRWRRDAQEFGQPRGDHAAVLVAERVDRLEVFLDGGRAGGARHRFLTPRVGIC
jgi:hypothetical protein